MRTDESHYAELCSGRTRSFDALYARFQTRLFGFALSLLKNRQDAEEVLQDTFKALIVAASNSRSEAQPNPVSSVEAWLFTICRNLCLNRMRRPRRTDQPVEDAPVVAEDAEDALIARGRQAALLRSVERLPEHLEEVYRLRAAGHDYETMARELRVPLGTIKSRIHALVRRLKEDLREWTVR